MERIYIVTCQNHDINIKEHLRFLTDSNNNPY